MKPVPVEPSKPIDGKAVVYAENQPQYQPLPSWQRSGGQVITRWRLSWRERFAVLRGHDIYLEQLTFGAPLQALYPSVDEWDVFGLPDPKA